MLEWIKNLYIVYPHMSTTITILFVSTAVGAMPSPQSPIGFYRWFFDFIHAFTGGLFRVLATRQSQAQTIGSIQGNIEVQIPKVEQAGVLTHKPYEEAVKVDTTSNMENNKQTDWKPKQ